MKLLSRRTMLRGSVLGGTAVALGLPQLDAMLNPSGAYAGGETPRPFFGVFYWANGVPWHARHGGEQAAAGVPDVWMPGATGPGYAMSEMLAPLGRHRTTLFSGLQPHTAVPSSPPGQVRLAGPKPRNPTPETRRNSELRNPKRGGDAPAGMDVAEPPRASAFGLRPSDFFRSSVLGASDSPSPPGPRVPTPVAHRPGARGLPRKPVSRPNPACYPRPMSNPVARSGGNRDAVTLRPHDPLARTPHAAARRPRTGPPPLAHP